MNVNFPDCAAAEVTGIAVVPQGKYDLQSTEIEERKDARSRAYYWIGLRRRKSTPPEESDIGALYAGKISVTPLHLNLTEHGGAGKNEASPGSNVNQALKPAQSKGFHG